MTEFIWSEKYRPHKVAEVILPDRLSVIFDNMIANGVVPNLLLHGTSGIGKTTVAMALCEQLGINHMLINASSERGIDTLRNKIVTYAGTMSFDGRPKVIILDEADGLTLDAQDALKSVIEKYSNNCTFILTANHKAKIIPALQSRTSHISFKLLAAEKPKVAMNYFYKIKEILKWENIQFEDKDVRFLVEKYFPDFRRTINEVQNCCQNGKLNVSAASDVQNLKDLMKFLKDKDFNKMRSWVVANSDAETDVLYRKIYDGLYEYFVPTSIPQAVVILAKYAYQSAFVSIPEINLVACLTELMIDTEFK